MMNYDGFNFVGMHLFWWTIWMFMLVWIFAMPYNIPEQRSKRETPLDILKRRFVLGEISKEEYQERKKNFISSQ
jgi:putative membrane protein